jgi:hypothetical protein
MALHELPMGVNAKDVAELVGTSTENDVPLGEHLRGMAGDLDLDSVEEVRNVRKRR